MNLHSSISILCLNFQVQVIAKFFYEQGLYRGGFGLYECEYKTDSEIGKCIDCKLVSRSYKKVVYSTASFYATHLPELEPGWKMYFSAGRRNHLPYFGFVGLIPGAMDLPKFKNWCDDGKREDEEFRDGITALSPSFIETQYLKHVQDYLRLNNSRLIMDHEGNWRELLSSYFLTLVKVMSVHTVRSDPKRILTLEDKDAATKWSKDVKTASKLFLNKMIDPCAILISGEEDERRANLYCQTYCEYIAFVGRLFRLTKHLCDECNHITDGVCLNQMCTCKQFKRIWKIEVNRQIKMLYCHNRFRLMLV